MHTPGLAALSLCLGPALLFACAPGTSAPPVGSLIAPPHGSAQPATALPECTLQPSGPNAPDTRLWTCPDGTKVTLSESPYATHKSEASLDQALGLFGPHATTKNQEDFVVGGRRSRSLRLTVFMKHIDAYKMHQIVVPRAPVGSYIALCTTDPTANDSVCEQYLTRLVRETLQVGEQ